MPLSDYPSAVLINAKSDPPKKNRRRLSVILIIAGLAIITFPFLTEVYGYFVQYRLNQEWTRQATKQQQQADLAQADQADRLSNRVISNEEAVLKEAVGSLKQSGHGSFPSTKIKIPKIKLEQVVLAGVESDVLKNGPGHYPGTAGPGQRGNIGIAGHRVTYTRPFNRLDELDTGDKVILETLDNIYEYRVVSSRQLDPKDLSALKPTKDARVTLTTCTPKYSAKYRLDVQASLAKVTPRQKPSLLRRLVNRLAKPREEKLPQNVIDLAVSQGQEDVAKNPNDVSARVYLGMLYRNMGRYDDAVAQLKKAIVLDKTYPQSYYELSLLYEKIGKTSEAISELNQAIKQEPRFEIAYYRLGVLYLGSNQADQAVNTFKQALSIDPFSADTHFYLGKAYEQQGNQESAIQAYRDAVRFVPNFIEADAAIRRLEKER